MSTYPGETRRRPRPDAGRPVAREPGARGRAAEPSLRRAGRGRTRAGHRADPAGRLLGAPGGRAGAPAAAAGRPDPSASQGAVFNPTSAQPLRWDQGGTRPYEQTPTARRRVRRAAALRPAGVRPAEYGQPPYAPPPYGQPAPRAADLRLPAPGGSPVPARAAPPGYPPYAGFAPPRPDHPQSTLALVLGIGGLALGFVLRRAASSPRRSPGPWAATRSRRSGPRGVSSAARAGQGRHDPRHHRHGAPDPRGAAADPRSRVLVAVGESTSTGDV